VEQSETVRNMPWGESFYGGEHYECLLLRKSHRQHKCFERVGFVCFDMPWPPETKHEMTYQALEDGLRGQNVPPHLHGSIDDKCRYSITLIEILLTTYATERSHGKRALCMRAYSGQCLLFSIYSRQWNVSIQADVDKNNQQNRRSLSELSFLDQWHMCIQCDIRRYTIIDTRLHITPYRAESRSWIRLCAA
jgi:hypothetical protein